MVMKKKPFLPAWTGLGIGSLLLVWELGARLAGSDLILPGPLLVARQGLNLMHTPTFLRSLGSSFWRVALGIIISAPLGVAAGIIAGLDKRGKAFFRPLFSVIAATPVMSVILIAFLALGAEQTPVFTAFLMVFPVMAANTIEGAGSIDPGLRELFRVYALPFSCRLRYLYIPSIAPFILAGLRSAISLSWKVVVAAEVLVQPVWALGTGMQRAKAGLETPELFAWTLGAVLAAGACQSLLNLALTFFSQKIGKKAGNALSPAAA
jgi:NitT/TauT family transport system permease protein